jgi:hypothetical protein
LKFLPGICANVEVNFFNLILLKVDTLDRWILCKFGPKNKYANSAAVPKTVSRAEIENAKSKFRIALNITAIILLVGTASYLIHYAKVKFY